MKKLFVSCLSAILLLACMGIAACAAENVNYDFGRYFFDDTVGLEDYEYLGMVEDVALTGQNTMHTVDVAHFRVPNVFLPGELMDRYSMYDFSRNIATFDAISDPSLIDPRPLIEAIGIDDFYSPVFYDTLVGYDEILWHPTMSAGNKQAVDAMYHAQQIYDHYLDRYGWVGPDGNGEFGVIMVVDVDRLQDKLLSETAINNAITTVFDYDNYRFIRICTGAAAGEASLADDPAVLAHEYGHGILFANDIHWVEGHESQAVHEGYADVFALCYDAFGWVLESLGRNHADPVSCGGIAHMDSYASSIDCHKTGMILGHSAYLMWTGMDGFEGDLDYDVLERLFLTSVKYLPDDPTFADAGNALIAASEELYPAYIDPSQKKCIRWALEKTGILPPMEMPSPETASDARGVLEKYYREVLEPGYGHAAGAECDRRGLEGILASVIEDISGDGVEELIIVRGEFSGDTYLISLEIYGPDSEEMRYGVSRLHWLGWHSDLVDNGNHDVRAAFALLESGGRKYIAMYNYFHFIDHSESMLLYYMDEKGIHMESGVSAYLHYNSAILYGTDTLSFSENIFNFSGDPEWYTICGGYADDASADYEKDLAAYTDAVRAGYDAWLSRYGMDRDGGYNLIYAQGTDFESLDKRTADELISGSGLRWLCRMTSAVGWDDVIGSYTFLETADLT